MAPLKRGAISLKVIPEGKLLSGLFLIDETYNLVTSESSDNFYVLAIVRVNKSESKFLRLEILNHVGSTFWHPTDNLRSDIGRARVLEFCKFVAGKIQFEIKMVRPLESGDRLGESARKSLLAQVIRSTYQDSEENQIVFERRSDGYQAQADSRLLKEMYLNELIPTNKFVQSASPKVEPLLWLPDLVATAHRQVLLRRNSRFFDALVK